MEKGAQWSLVGAAWVLAVGVIALGAFAIYRFSGDGGGGGRPGLGTPERPLCPVDRMEITLAADTPKANYMGHDYFFCTRRDERGRDHKTLFLMDPELYLSGTSTLKPLSGSAAAGPAEAP